MFTLCRRQLARCLLLSARSFQPQYSRPSARICLPQRRERLFSTPPPQVNDSGLAMDRYHALSDVTMDRLLDSLEELLDRLGNPEYEVEYHSGVLTLNLGNKGTYVVNKQPPNKQIWLSSPLSGPKRYDYFPSEDDWLYARDGCSLGQLLNTELSKMLDAPVNVQITAVSQLI